MASKYNPNAFPSGSEQVIYNNQELRIVMVGKTGGGKSTTGNNILGSKHFKSEFSFTSVTRWCDKSSCDVDGQRVVVVDTPGLFDTNMDQETTCKHLAQSIYFASPGPHILLFIIQLGRYTEEEKKTVQKIQEIYGKDADKYSMVLFTHGDVLGRKPIEESIEESKELKKLVATCNNQYHVFNNLLDDRSQVEQLLDKIRRIIKKNGGSHYTNDMFQAAERAIEEEKERILKEREEEIRKEEEEKRKTIEDKYEKLLKETEIDKKEIQLMAARQAELEEEIKKLNKEQKRREEEQKRKTIEDKYEKLLKETEIDKKEIQLMAARQAELEEEIKKLNKEQKCREEEQKRKTIEDKYEKLLKETETDEKEIQLMAARQAELEREIKKLQEKVERLARQEAERNENIFPQICSFLLKGLGSLFGPVGVVEKLFEKL